MRGSKHNHVLVTDLCRKDLRVYECYWASLHLNLTIYICNDYINFQGGFIRIFLAKNNIEDLNSYGIKELRDGLTLRKIKKDFPWLLESKVEDAVVGLNKMWDNIVWSSGVWKDGTWQGFQWQDGTWESGTWKDGTWWDGTWKRGLWCGGLWKEGDWQGGKWTDTSTPSPIKRST